MQNYGQPPGYQRPGSTASFAGQQQQQQQAAPPPPAYGGYPSPPVQNQNQWSSHSQNQGPNQQWNPPQQQTMGGYNTGSYGATPGGQHDQPPPPPPKPYGFAGAVQQQQNQTWPQPQQQTMAHAPPQQQLQQLGGYPVQGGAQSQQQSYNPAAPPPSSATPGGSYFPPAQGGRPGSVYGANQVGSLSQNTPSGPPQPSAVMSPNEQQPAYIPPSLTGQGVQAYMPSNTNPLPGVYVPPPPDIPAWQQAQHAPLQDGPKKFRYTKPTVDPSFYAQGYQGVDATQPPPPPPPLPPHPVQYAQPPAGAPHPQQPLGPPPPLNHYAPQGQVQQHPPPQFHPQQQPYGQPSEQPSQFHQQPVNQSPYNTTLQNQYVPQPELRPPPPQMASNMSKPYNSITQRPDAQSPSGYGASNMSKPYNQWNAPAPVPAGQTYVEHQQHAPSTGQQPQWQTGHHQGQDSQSSLAAQHYTHLPGQDVQAPKPLGRTDTASSNFFAQSSPQSQPVSPVHNRQSMSFSVGQPAGLGRTGSVSSIVLANMHAQREENRTSSPRPAPPHLPTPPPPRDDKSKFSVLGTGGPSDWEHFGADAEIDDEEIFAKKVGPVQLDSVELPASQPELPAGPSPPSTHGWPSPAPQPAASISGERKDTYQPTPPPVRASLAERLPPQQVQQSFVMADTVAAPLSISPKPQQNVRPPSTQQKFDLSDGAWQPPKQPTPAQQESQHKPLLPAEQNAGTEDGGRVAYLQQETPNNQAQQLSPVVTGFVMNDNAWGASQRTPTQGSTTWGSELTEKHAVELRAKEEDLERMRLNIEEEKADLYAETERLRLENESAMTHAGHEKVVLQEQIETMKIASEQAKINADAAVRDKDITIERMKEDAEGKEHNINERDAIIADLKRQLEAEKSKEPVKVTPLPADLISDIDPWYVGSLERYITMLRNEASEPRLEEKIKTFKAFLKAESIIRGIEYYDTPPMAPKHEATVPVAEPKVSNTANPVTSRADLNVQVPKALPESPDEEDYDYSPGGRPVLTRKPTVPSSDIATVQDQVVPATHSKAILTPTSSVGEDSDRTPVQSSPEEQPQPLYKAYVPPALFLSDSAQSVNRQSTSDVPALVSAVPHGSTSFEQRPVLQPGTSMHHDEIFFGAGGTETSKRASRPTSSDSASHGNFVPAPLAFASNRSGSTSPPSMEDPSEVLHDLLPVKIAPVTHNRVIEAERLKLSQLGEDARNIDDLTKEWEKTATVTRKKNDSSRRKRQEENEEANDDAFNNDEISYADLNVLEKEFKQKEDELKAKEDRDEYASYVQAVFDPLYDALQCDIKALMDMYMQAESLLHTSESGLHSLEPNALSTLASLELLQEIHAAILDRQDHVVAVVAERDKRYRKTETQPLYASGNITKMKAVEKHFDNAEKEAHIRALRDKAGRVGELVSIAEDIVVNAVGTEQRETDRILEALRDLEDGSADADLVTRAHDTLVHLKTSSKSLLSLLNTMEIQHNATVLDAEIAQAKLEGKDVARLEEEKAKGENKFMDEFKRRVEVLEQDSEEIERLIGKKGGEEATKERRMKAALEEAKKRNGDV